MKKLTKLQQEIAKNAESGGEVLQFLQMLHLVLDTIPQRIFWKDTNHVYMGCNNNFALDAGLKSTEDVIGLTDFDMPWRDTADKFRGYDREVMQSGKPKIRYDQAMPNADGQKIIIRVNKVPLLDRKGHIIGVLGSYEDITQHKKMEMELLLAAERRRSEDQIRKLSHALENSPVSVLITDRQGRIEYVNQKFTALSGYSAKELIGQTPNILKSGNHPPEFYKEMWDTLFCGYDWSGEFCNRKKDGSIYWESARISPLKDSDGNITHFVGLKEDITEKKAYQEALLESEKKFRAIFEGANDAIILISAGKIFDCNPHAVKMFGYHNKEDVIGLDPVDISSAIQPDGKDSHAVAKEVKEIAIKEGFCRFEWIHFHKSGDVVPLDIHLTPLKWGDRMIMQAVIRDITERKLAEIELRNQKEAIEESYQKLKDLEKLRDNLVHMIVHDMRSPLTGINLSFEVLKMNPHLDANAVKTLNMGQKSASELLSMVTELLDISRMESGNMPLSKKKENVYTILKTVADSFPSDVMQRSLSLSASEEMTAHFDADIIRRIVTNLIGNAIKFTTKNGHIQIIAKQDEGFIKISVQDDGYGIPPEYHSRIFEKFGQAESKKKKFGTGLGLTFCKLAIEAHGGTIGVESEVGKGSNFWFTIPSDNKAPDKS